MLNATPFLRAYSKLALKNLSRAESTMTQERVLLSLISRAKETQFGKKHFFDSVRSVSEFQSYVSPRTYEQFWEEYFKGRYPDFNNLTWKGRMPYFCLSSGTTSGTTKYIPVSHEMVKSNTQAGLNLLSYHVQQNPSSQIFGGKSFVLGGSTDLQTPIPGVLAGDLSGIAAKTLPFWAQARFFPPADIALIKNWEEKIDLLAEKSIGEDIRSISGVPSWLLIFFNKLFEVSGKNSLSEVFPKLEMIVHGGVNFSPYVSQFRELIKGSKAELREVYPASEGFIAVADRGYGEGLKLNLNNDLFYEFIPVEELENEHPTRHWVKNIEKDVNYAIVLTTCAGLWSYILGDTVRFVDTETPRLLVTGRTSYSLSAFGEHLIAEEVENALSVASIALGVTIVDYSVGPVFPKSAGDLGGHLYVIECNEQGKITAELMKRFGEIVDSELCKLNEDYDGHRAKGFGLKDPEIIFVKTGTFAEWMRSRGKLGGQNKVPRLISKPELFENLVEFIEGRQSF